MIKFLVIPLVAVTLAGCASVPTVIRSQKAEVVMPSEALFNCPALRNIPNPDTLTDAQVAKLITTLYSNDVTCRNSMKSLKSFLNKARRVSS